MIRRIWYEYNLSYGKFHIDWWSLVGFAGAEIRGRALLGSSPASSGTVSSESRQMKVLNKVLGWVGGWEGMGVEGMAVVEGTGGKEGRGWKGRRGGRKGRGEGKAGREGRAG